MARRSERGVAHATGASCNKVMGQKAPGPRGVASEMRACGVAPLARTLRTVRRGAPCDGQEVRVPREDTTAWMQEVE